MAESMINRIALLYKKAKSSAWGRTFKSDSERNFYIAEYLVKNDVVEVVRCKDCRFFGKNRPWRNNKLPFSFCDKFHHNIMRENDFCSYGKGKEVANNG